jgi:hypothetical protein
VICRLLNMNFPPDFVIFIYNPHAGL